MPTPWQPQRHQTKRSLDSQLPMTECIVESIGSKERAKKRQHLLVAPELDANLTGLGQTRTEHGRSDLHDSTLKRKVERRKAHTQAVADEAVRCAAKSEVADFRGRLGRASYAWEKERIRWQARYLASREQTADVLCASRTCHFLEASVAQHEDLIRRRLRWHPRHCASAWLTSVIRPYPSVAFEPPEC